MFPWLEFSSDNYCLINTNDQSLTNAGKTMGDMFLVRHCCENLYFCLMMCFPRLFPHMLLICCAFLMSLLSLVFPNVNHLPLSLPFMFYNGIIMRRNDDCVWEDCHTAWKFQGSKQIGLISACFSSSEKERRRGEGFSSATPSCGKGEEWPKVPNVSYINMGGAIL